MVGTVAVAVAHLVATATFVGLAGWVGISREKAAPRRLLAGACLATAGWTALTALSWWGGNSLVPLADLAEGARTILWLWILLQILSNCPGAAGVEAGRRLLPGRLLLLGFALLILLTGATFVVPPEVGRLCRQLPVAVLLLLSVCGLALTERVYGGSDPAGRWGAKHLMLGLATLFTSDIFFHADTLLLADAPRDGNAGLTRGLIVLILVPLLVVSIRRCASWSRPSAFRGDASLTATLQGIAVLGSGLYLLGMAALAFLVREIGGDWGVPLRSAFMVGGFVAMFLLLGSGRFMARAKVYVHKAFFTYKYDYREEWRRFIGMLSAHHALPLAERILHAVADMLDTPAGALWVWREEEDAFLPECTWNYHGPTPSEPADGAFAAALRDRGWIIEVREPGRNDPPIALPSFLADHRPLWLVVPLFHRGRLLGFLALDQARSPRRIDWEDRDLIKVAAAHAASCLAEEKAAAALRDAALFQELSRRFSFVAHDLKTVVFQMSLILDNAERFGDDPQFQRDVLVTVKNSNARMKALLEQISEKQGVPVPVGTVDLAAIVTAVVERWRQSVPGLVLTIAEGSYALAANDEQLVSVLDLLIDNAVGAIGPDGQIEVRLCREGGAIRLEVADDGVGMDPDFVRHDLFRLMRSTKSGGYGLGAYQTRHIIRELGGHLDVDTALHQGTTMRVLLPSA